MRKEFFEPIGDSFEPMTEVEVQKLESDLNESLPADLRDFLKTYGSCGFNGFANIKLPNGEEYPIDIMFGAETSSNSILKDWLAHPDYQKAKYIPIATDFFSNRIVFDLREKCVRHIFYTQFGPTVTFVADSFSQFLENIIVSPYDDE